MADAPALYIVTALAPTGHKRTYIAFATIGAEAERLTRQDAGIDGPGWTITSWRYQRRVIFLDATDPIGYLAARQPR